MSADESISALQERIAFHANKAAELKSLYNSHTSIAKLPPEILAEVFLIQAAVLRREALDRFSQSDRDVRHHSFYRWINVSHVCRYWREVAFNCATLWTWVVFDQRIPSDFPLEMLEHARDLPLTVIFSITDTIGHCDGCVDMDWFYDNFHEQASQVCTLVPRAREILIFVDRSNFDDDQWEDMLSASSDVLEVFRIEAHGGSRFRQLSLPPRSASVTVTDLLFASPPPNLRTLSFVGVECGWSNALLCSSLRHLELTSCHITESQDNTDLRAFLHALRKLPNLETLKLDWPLLTEIDVSGCAPVYLPHLTSIHLGADNQRLTALLSYLQMPPTTSIRCVVLDSFFNDTDRQPFQTTLARLFDKQPIYAVGWGMPTGHHTRGDISTQCRIWAAQERAPRPQGLSWKTIEATPPRLTVETSFKPSVDIVTPAVLQALDLSTVETIQIAGSTPSRSWARALKKAENVRILRVAGMAAFALPAVLGSGVPEDPEEDWQICLAGSVADADEWHWIDFDKDEPLRGGHGTHDRRTGDGDQHMLVDDASDAISGQVASVEVASAVPLPPPGPAVFPRLRELQLLDFDIHLPVPPPYMHYSEASAYYPRATDALYARFSHSHAKYGFSIAGLLKCLRVRAEQGAFPVERVSFEECACPDPGLLRRMAGVVPEVVWDGLLVRDGR